MEPQWDSPRGGGSDGEVIVVIVFGFGLVIYLYWKLLNALKIKGKARKTIGKD
jgi:hypothetical protein